MLELVDVGIREELHAGGFGGRRRETAVVLRVDRADRLAAIVAAAGRTDVVAAAVARRRVGPDLVGRSQALANAAHRAAAAQAGSARHRGQLEWVDASLVDQREQGARGCRKTGIVGDERVVQALRLGFIERLAARQNRRYREKRTAVRIRDRLRQRPRDQRSRVARQKPREQHPTLRIGRAAGLALVTCRTHRHTFSMKLISRRVTHDSRDFQRGNRPGMCSYLLVQ